MQFPFGLFLFLHYPLFVFILFFSFYLFILSSLKKEDGMVHVLGGIFAC
jgi:hypothetical protein